VRQTLRNWTAAGSHKVKVGLAQDQVPGALLADLQPVDLLEAARAIGEEALPRLRVGALGNAHSSSQAPPSAYTAI
jgi:hypothetical protein